MSSDNIHRAARNGDLEEVEEILKKSTEKLNEKDIYGCTPLHRAAGCGHLKVVVKLVELGAKLNEKNHQGHTPFDSAGRGNINNFLNVS